MANVVVGLLLENALAQRQDRLRSVQSLDLALLITSTAAPITYERLVSWDWRRHRHYSASGPKQADGPSSADTPPKGRHYLCPNHKHLSDTGQGDPHGKHTHRTQPPRRDPRRRLGHPATRRSTTVARVQASSSSSAMPKWLTTTYVGPATAERRHSSAALLAPDEYERIAAIQPDAA